MEVYQKIGRVLIFLLEKLEINDKIVTVRLYDAISSVSNQFQTRGEPKGQSLKSMEFCMDENLESTSSSA